jgi:hypothetical protein
VTDFVKAFTAKLREAGHESVDAMFDEGSDEPVAAPAKAPSKTLRSARSARALPASSSGAVTIASIVEVVKRNPGCNGGTIVRELGKPRHAILRPLAEAVATGKIRKNGSGRGLTYTAGR